MTNKILKYVLTILLIALSSVVTERFTESIYKNDSDIHFVTEKFSSIMNKELKSNKDLKYRIAPIGVKENNLIYVSILQQKFDFSSDSSSYYEKNLDTTFYVCTHKYFWSNYEFNKIEIQKDSSIWNYLFTRDYIFIKTWFKN